MSISKQRKRYIAVNNVFMQSIHAIMQGHHNHETYPIPDITGQAAIDFEQDIKTGPTELQKEVMKRATAKFAKTKKQKQ